MVEDRIVDKVKDAEKTILNRIGKHQGFVQKRIDSVDINTRFLLKYQEMAIHSVSRKVRNLEKLFRSTLIKENEEEPLNEVEKLEQ